MKVMLMAAWYELIGSVKGVLYDTFPQLRRVNVLGFAEVKVPGECFDAMQTFEEELGTVGDLS